MTDSLVKNTVVPLLLRLGLAVIFITHGLAKVGGDGNEGGLQWMRGPDAPAKPVQFAVAWGELLGGIALAIGFMTRLAAAGIAVIMAGAIWTVTGRNGFHLIKDGTFNGGYEYNLVLLVICAAVILLGPGPLAADRWFGVRRKN